VPSTGRVEVPCPIGRAVDILGDRWTLLLLRNATVGVTRFDDFRGRLGIADNILSNRLARLVDAGLLVRVPYRDKQRTRHESAGPFAHGTSAPSVGRHVRAPFPQLACVSQVYSRTVSAWLTVRVDDESDPVRCIR
jgi:hypothetical protein